LATFIGRGIGPGQSEGEEWILYVVLRIYELPSIQTASSHGRYDRFAFASEAFGHSCLVSSSVYRELDFLAESRRRRTLSVLQVGRLRSSEWRIVGFTGSRIHNSQLGPFGEIQKQISIMTSTLLAILVFGEHLPRGAISAFRHQSPTAGVFDPCEQLIRSLVSLQRGFSLTGQ
jgi:hypothetical protein